MSQIDKTTFNSLYNNASGGVFPNNSTQEISAADVRSSMADIKDSFLNKTDESFNGIRGINPGVSTITNLKALVTATPRMPAGVLMIFLDSGSSDALRVYRLTTGTTAESSPDIIRPDDYAASTNEKIWVLADLGVSVTVPDASPSVKGILKLYTTSGSNTDGTMDQASIAAAITSALDGLKWKQPVKVATTANGTLATAYENGDTIDGIALVTGDRILIKNQTTQTENGIYTVNASGAPTRSSDANSAAELEGAAVTVQQGTSNANTTWTQTTDNITLGSSNIVWGQFGSSVPNADASTRGIAKLFTTTGSGTDGAMDQNSVTNALASKVDETDFVALTDGATTTWDTQTLQNPLAKWTMGATSRTLAMTNLKSGASGLLVVKTGVSGAITLTFPAGSVTDAGSLTTYTFPAGINVFYDLTWWYDSTTTTTKWIIGVSNIDIDPTMTADSDTLVPSQKAVKTALATKQASLGFTAENVANKAVDFSTLNNTKYPTTQAVNDILNITVSGLKPKLDARAATTGNITLSGAQTIDGVSIVAGERVLVKNQTTGSQNGIYVAASGSWSRSSDAAIATDLQGALVAISEGTLNVNTLWRQTAIGITVGTTAIVWAQPYRAEPLASTGTVVAFDVDRHYGFSSAETGNITINTTGLRKGITQFMKHNSGSTPSFGSEFEVISGAYSISVNNLLTFYSISASKIFVTITQIA